MCELTLCQQRIGNSETYKNGLQPEVLLNRGYGHAVHIWDLRRRVHRQVLDLGKEYQPVFELRPAHDLTKAYGFAGVAMSLKDLSASICL